MTDMTKQTEAISTFRALKLALEGAANYIDALGGDSRKYRQALAEQPAQQQEPVVLKWQQAPIRTAWGDDMVVASVAIDKDHTVCFYCERDQAPKVDAMFAQRKPLTDDEIQECWYKTQGDAELFARAIEAAHSIKENT